MSRGIWIVVALLSTTPVHGQGQESTKDTTGTKTAPAPKKRAKKGAAEKKPDAGSSAAWGGTGGTTTDSPARKKSAPAAPKHAAERSAMLRLRDVYRYAVESCDSQGRACDGALRDDAEHRFMDGCLACTTREQCEAERDLIRSGKSRSMTPLCSD